MTSLAAKIDRAKDEHADEEFNKLKNYHEEQAFTEAIFILGRIKQNDHLAGAIAATLSAQTMRALERFQQEKKFKALGFPTFDKFLDESPHSTMTKNQYYQRMALVRKLGDDPFDLLTTMGISFSTQKLLEKGDVVIEGDKVFINGEERDRSDPAVIHLLQELFDERRQLKDAKIADEAEIARVKKENAAGKAELEKKQREIDAQNEDSSFTKAFSSLVMATLNLINEVKALPESEREKRADDDIEILTRQSFLLADAYGVKRSLSKEMFDLRDKVAEMKPVGEMTDEEKADSLADRALSIIDAEDGFDDLD